MPSSNEPSGRLKPGDHRLLKRLALAELRRLRAAYPAIDAPGWRFRKRATKKSA